MERQELDGGRPAAYELRRDRDVGQVHESGELQADLVGLRLLESEAVAVEAQRPLEVADADSEVREHWAGGVVHDT